MAKTSKRRSGKFAVFFGVLLIAGVIAQETAPLLGRSVVSRELLWFGTVFTAVGILGGVISVLVLLLRRTP